MLEFAERIDDRRTGPLARLGVITGTGYAYDRPDGVAVVPIGTLGPRASDAPGVGDADLDQWRNQIWI